MFLNYIKDNDIVAHHPFFKEKDTYLYSIDKSFPEASVIDKINVLMAKDERAKVIADKFNGEIVMEWLPELKGKELGQAIGKFKDALGDKYDEYVLNTNIGEIRVDFMKIYYE